MDDTTIHNWETDATTPALRLIPRIIGFLGRDPFLSAESLPERRRAARRLGLSQERLATRLGVDESTHRHWENARHRPTRKSLQSINDFLRRCFKATELTDFSTWPRAVLHEDKARAIAGSRERRANTGQPAAGYQHVALQRHERHVRLGRWLAALRICGLRDAPGDVCFRANGICRLLCSDDQRVTAGAQSG